MPLDRRFLIALAGLGAGLAPAAAAAAKRVATTPSPSANTTDTNLVPDGDRDQTDALQRLIDEAANRKIALQLPPGRFLTRTLALRKGSRIAGSGASVLRQEGSGAILTADDTDDLNLTDITLDGRFSPASGQSGLITLRRGNRIVISGVTVRDGLGSGIVLEGCSGSVRGCVIESVAEAAIFSTDATGLEITANTIRAAGNNGILVWRSNVGEDGTIVSGNRIEKVAANNGGSGQNGNAAAWARSRSMRSSASRAR